MCIFRRALANALAAAPSMWTLGNAGMGALQVSDHNFIATSTFHRQYGFIFSPL